MKNQVLSCLLLLTSAGAFAPTSQIMNHQIRSTRAHQSLLASAVSANNNNEETTTTVVEGLVKTVVEAGRGSLVNLGDIATVQYSCSVPTEVPFSKSKQQKMVVGDGSMIPGWDKALRSMKIGERAVFQISDSNLAYGPDGVPPLIPGASAIDIDLHLIDAQPPMANIDFDNLAMADSTPRTAEQISAAYEVRRAQAALIPELEGLEGWIAKAKTFYFFGLFEGETGQEAPWFLRPSITFPIAFLIVGAAFYVSFAVGGISERGAQVTDELDEIMLTSNAVYSGFQLAMTTMLSSGTSGSGIDSML